MHKEEFEREMEEYLRARKKAGFNIKAFFQNLLPKKREKVEMPEEVEVYEEEAKQEPKEGMLAKLFKKEEPINEELLRTRMQVEDMTADMKEISKIALSVVKQLPDEQLRAFKESPDFEKLKVVLKKHDLIK
ncbi:Uncharacterised protein [uncultured archaeon]|nr:Uncharacterised protein [uncultured archaeon]